MRESSHFSMKQAVDRAVQDREVLQFVSSATQLKYEARKEAFAHDFGHKRYQHLRQLAGRIRQDVVENLDHVLDQFTANAQQAGTVVHRARDARHANELCLQIAKANECRLCVKSKSMVTEEIGLVPDLIAAGIETIETDLGEFIVQLDGDTPSHIVTPMIHKNRASVARAFVRELGVEYTEDPEQLTAIAREYMRGKYRQADLGISGANFLLADSGTAVVCTNEGNADLAVNMPRIHIIVAGMEKVIPGHRELAVFLKLLARSATAQPLTVYTTCLTGPRRPPEQDGPERVHIILLDNGRSAIQADLTSRELLRCIRCGACLNACPVFRNVGGGHAYGAVYSGPIGAAIMPLLQGLETYHELPEASSLCGACYEVCPVSIDLPSHLIRHRREGVDQHLHSWSDRFMYRAWAYVLQHPTLYRGAQSMARWVGRALAGAGSSGGRVPVTQGRSMLPGIVGFHPESVR
ncbi:MAG: lactate utilization protein [Planctomycetes bacterium]|nr:lactate utilization protein [Planctomycetota bacterium]